MITIILLHLLRFTSFYIYLDTLETLETLKRQAETKRKELLWSWRIKQRLVTQTLPQSHRDTYQHTDTHKHSHTHSRAHTVCKITLLLTISDKTSFRQIKFLWKNFEGRHLKHNDCLLHRLHRYVYGLKGHPILKHEFKGYNIHRVLVWIVRNCQLSWSIFYLDFPIKFFWFLKY